MGIFIPDGDKNSSNQSPNGRRPAITAEDVEKRKKPQVIILGAGFGGLWAARQLANQPVDVMIIDRNNYHTFYPLLYQVGAAEVAPAEIADPVRDILRGKGNVDYCMSEVQTVDLDAKTVKTSGLVMPYDYLIVAMGSINNFYNIPCAAEYTFNLKSLENALALRNHILECFEEAAHETDPERRQRLLTFAIVGGGPTGVEFAGALSELFNGPLCKDYPMLEGQARILLIEAANSLLAGQPEKLSNYALRRLEKMGVQIMLNAAVTKVGPDQADLKDGTSIPTHTMVWTAGVSAAPQSKAWNLPLNRQGRVEVLPTLQAPGYPEVYVVGDMAEVKYKGKQLPMVAQPAIQEGVAAARNILRQVSGQDPEPFHYHDLGTLAVIGRNSAVADIAGLQLTGFLAWLIWAGVHIFNLIGFRNRVIVLIDWAFDYFFSERGIRLILPTPVEVKNREEAQPAEQKETIG